MPVGRPSRVGLGEESCHRWMQVTDRTLLVGNDQAASGKAEAHATLWKPFGCNTILVENGLPFKFSCQIHSEGTNGCIGTHITLQLLKAPKAGSDRDELAWHDLARNNLGHREKRLQ